MSVKIYDDEIAPLLKAVADKCVAHGMPIVAVVEYAPSERGRTLFVPDSAGLEMVMQLLCAGAGANIDSYLINLVRHAKEKGIDMGESMFLRQFMEDDKQEGHDAGCTLWIDPPGSDNIRRPCNCRKGVLTINAKA